MRYLLIGFLVVALSCHVARAEEPSEKALKYHQVLQSRPEPGYLFDRFYDTWLNAATVASLEAFLKEKAGSEGATTSDHLLLAYFHSRHGDSVEAIQQFRTALEKEPENPGARLQMARAEAQTLDFDGAITNLERALGSSPKPDLAKEILQLLGRYQSRNGERQKAVATWERLRVENPDDDELQEDVIELFASEGMFPEAIASCKNLVTQTKDPYRSVLRQIRLGGLYQQADQRDRAVETYASCLGRVGSGSWIEKEIYAQIETIFRREDDLLALKDFYRGLIAEDGKRLALLRQNADLLAELGETEEAIGSFKDILAITPGDRPLREGFISLLVSLGENKAALQQLEALAALEPGDAEIPLQKADLQFRDGKNAECEKCIAEFLEKSAGGEAHHLRACRLLDRYNLRAAADRAYATAVEKFPGSPTALDAQATYLHRTDRKTRAIAIWKKLAEGGDVARVIQIARSIAARGEDLAAYELLHARLADFSDEPQFLTLLCDLAVPLRKFEVAVPWSRKLVGFSEQSSDIDLAISRAIRIADAADAIANLVDELERNDARNPQETCLLAELFEHRSESDYAERELESIADSHPLLANNQLSRLHEKRGDWRSAASYKEKVLELPGGRKSLHVRKIIELSQRAGETERALRWLPEWKKISPGSELPWLIEARIYSDGGQAETAIRTLRLAAQAFEDSDEIRAELAKAYVAEDQLAEAERIFQRLYDEADDLTRKLQWVVQLARVSINRGTTEDLIQRFEARRRNNRQSIIPLRALAEIHRIGNDYEKRRQVLHQAALLKPDDIGLLHEIATIEQREGDDESALATLRTAAKLDKTPGSRERIAKLFLSTGRDDEAFTIIGEIAAENQLDARGVENVAIGMANARRWEATTRFLAPHLDQFPHDYRLRYLDAVAVEENGEHEAAAWRFSELLSIQKETLQPSNSPAQSALVDALPEASREVLRVIGSREEAYAHRSQSQPSRGGYSFQAPASQVRLPQSLDELKTLTLCHLNTIGRMIPDPELAKLKADLKTRGILSSRFILDFEVNGDPSEQFVDLLEKFPDDVSVNALAIQASYSDPDLSPQQLRDAYDLLAEKHPDIAFKCGLLASMMEGEQPQALAMEAVDRAKEVEVPTGLALEYLTWALSTEKAYRDDDAGFIPEEIHSELCALVVDWYHHSNPSPGPSNPTLNQIIKVLFAREDPDLLVEFINREYPRAARDPKNSYSVATSNPFGALTPELVSPIRFPPQWLPGEPTSFLTALVSYDDPFGESEDIDEKKLALIAKQIESPILRIHMLSEALQLEQVEKEISKLSQLEAPDLQTHLLLAAYHASEDDNAKAVELILKASKLPVSKEVRQQIDSSLAVWVSYCVAGSQDDIDSILPAGREAALRLRSRAKSAEERSNLATVLETLGLQEESEKLAKLAVTSPISYRGFGAQVISNPQPSKTRVDRIATLLKQQKEDRALRMIATEARPQIRAILNASNSSVSSFGTVSSSQIQWLRTKKIITKNGLVPKVLKSFDPGDSTSSRRWAEYAAAHELLDREWLAQPFYEMALQHDPGNESAQMRYVPMIAHSQPDLALSMLLGLRPSFLAYSGPALPASIDEHDVSDEANLRMESLARLATRFLRKHPNLGRSDLYWVRQIADRSLHKTQLPKDAESLNGAQRKRIAERAAIYQALVGAMLETPQLAYNGFERRSFHLRNAPGGEKEIADTARRVLLVAERRLNATEIGLPDPPELVAVRQAKKDNDRAGIDAFAQQLHDAGKRFAAEEIEYLTDLHFSDTDAFLKAAEDFQRNRKNGYSDFGTPVLETVIDVWDERQLEIDLSDFVIASVRRSIQVARRNHQLKWGEYPGNNQVAQQALILSRRGGYPAVEEFLDRFVPGITGRTTNAKRSIDEQETLSNYFALFRQFPEIAINALSFQEKYIPEIEYLRLNQDPFGSFGGSEVQAAYKAPLDARYEAAEWIGALRGSPFFCTLAEFRTFPLPPLVGGSGFAQIISPISELPEETRVRIVEYIEAQPDCFGRQLMLAAVNGGPAEFYEFLATQRGLIDSLPEERQFEIAALSYGWRAPDIQLSREAGDLQRHFAVIRPGGDRDQRRKFLALEEHPSTIALADDLERLLAPLVASRRDKGREIFRKATELWEKNPSRTVMDGTSEPGAWAKSLAIRDDSLDSHAFILELVASKDLPRVEIDPHFLLENKLTRLALLYVPHHDLPREEVLLSGVKGLEPYVRAPETMPLLIGAVFEYLDEASPDLRKKSMEVLDTYAPESPLAKEFAKAAQLLTPDPDYDHYLRYLGNAEISLTARLAVYDLLKGYLEDALPGSFTHQATRLVAQSWKDSSPLPHEFTETLLPQFCALQPHDEQWKTTAVALADSWHPIRSGWSIPITSHLLELSLGEGKVETAERIAKLGDEKNSHADASWIQILVKYREFALARRVLLKNWEKFAFTESDSLVFVDDYPAAVAEFLPTIEQPEIRFFASLILAAAEDQRIGDALARRQDQEERLSATLGGYQDAGIDFVPNQQLLLGLLNRFDSVADQIPEAYAALAKTYSITDYQNGMRVQIASNQMRIRSEIYLAHLRQRVAREGAPAVEHFFELLTKTLPDYEATSSRIAVDAGGFLDAIQRGVISNWQNLPQENLKQVAKLYREFITQLDEVNFVTLAEEVIADNPFLRLERPTRPGELVRRDLGTFGFLLLVHQLADDAAGLEAWRKSLTGRSVVLYKSSDTAAYRDAFTVWERAFEKSDFTADRRIELIIALLQDPAMSSVIETEPGLARSVASVLTHRHLLSEEEFLARGMEVARAAPCLGHLPAAIARKLEEKNRLPQAQEAWDLAIASTPKLDWAPDDVEFTELVEFTRAKARLVERMRRENEEVPLPDQIKPNPQENE